MAGGNVFVRGSVEGAIIQAGKYSHQWKLFRWEKGELIASEDVYLSHVNSGTIRTEGTYS